MKQPRLEYRVRKEFCILLARLKYQELARSIQLCELIANCRGILMDTYSAKDVADYSDDNQKLYCSLYKIKLGVLLVCDLNVAEDILTDLCQDTTKFKVDCLNPLLRPDLISPLTELIALANENVVHEFFCELREILEE